MVETKNKTIELWDGYEVEVNEQLFKDADFLFDLDEARQEGNFRDIVAMMFAVVGGEDVYEATREHIIKQCGHFSIDELTKITDKIGSCFPKAGNRASRRQKWTRR